MKPYLVDDDAPKTSHKDWWLERYTLDEIREMASGLVGALDIQESKARTGTCEAEGCNTVFKVRANNQRFCSERCRKRTSERTAPWRIEQVRRKKERYDALRAVGVPSREAKLLADSPTRTAERLEMAA